jgi:K+-transporting ATPase ATPase A chain
MPAAHVAELVIYFGIVLLLMVPLGRYMARVYQGEVWLARWLGPLERILYKVAGVDPAAEQPWYRYAAQLLVFQLVSGLGLYAILRLQQFLPLNPQRLGPLPPAVAFNTAVSFLTNTNWQAYSGEAQLSYFSQMALIVQQFVSPAVGLAVAVALFRGIARQSSKTIGNFYRDLVRGLLYVLLPLVIPFALLLSWQGVPQSLAPYHPVTTVQGQVQQIPGGPAAAMTSIMMIGSNGGGYFGANNADPLENPSALSNLIVWVMILLVPFATVFTYGEMVGSRRQAWTIFAVMLTVLLAGFALTWNSSRAVGPRLAALPVRSSSGNMVGVEERFGPFLSSLYLPATTGVSNGSVNSAFDSANPVAGMVALADLMLGCITPGGDGAGMYGILFHVLFIVFLAGLMVGRTPEFLGKKISIREAKLVMIGLLITPVAILLLAAPAAVLPASLASVSNPGPHGLSQILYAYSSGVANNGSAFGGFGAALPYSAIMVGVAMFLGRYLIILPALAIAGSLAAKTSAPVTAGTLPTSGWMFGLLLLSSVLVVAGLSFFPALALGPVAEHFALWAGQLFPLH